MGGSNRDIEKEALEAEKRAKKLLTPAQQYAIGVVGKNVKNGVFWGFTSMADIKQYWSQIQNDGNNIRAKLLGGQGSKDVLVEVNPDYLIGSVAKVLPNVFTQKNMQHIQDNRTSTVIEFEKFLVNKGISKEGYLGNLAIYCINEVSTINYKGVSYPAFRLSAEMALRILAKYGYMVRGADGSFIQPQALLQNLGTMWQLLQVSPTKTGAFIGVKSTLPVEQLKIVRKQMKAAQK